MATPAEGCTGRLCKLIAKRFGIIPGITDKKYLVNSSHVPPKFHISVADKIRIEAPYHELENAGHIFYCEQDADISKNPEALEDIVTMAADAGCGYIAVNHPVTRDPVCGYVGPLNPDGTCPRCGRKEYEGVTARKLLNLTAYSPDPEYAVTSEKLEDEDKTINDL
jgi:ribonucleoside-triphosphate reductase